MDAESRERIRREAERSPHDFEIDMDDLAALLADSEALERVRYIRDRWEIESDSVYHAKELSKAIGRG